MGLDECTVCGCRVPGDGHALGTSIGSGEHAYIPIVDDLPDDPPSLGYVACFTDGLASLVDVFRQYDTRDPTEILELLNKVGATGGD